MNEEALPPRQRFARPTASAASTVVLSLLLTIFLAAHYLSSPNNYTADYPTSLLQQQQQQQQEQRVLFFSLRDNDYKTVTPRIGHPLKEDEALVDDNEQQQQQQQHELPLESPLFIVPQTQLVSTKHKVPTITRARVIPQGSHAIVDVLSIGSKARPEFLTTQRDTWANHNSVRNFWGVTEEQDYNPNCANDTPENEQKSFLNACWPKGSKREYRGWGWFCAQRRPGHALGYIQHVYHHHDLTNNNNNDIPDILIIVDDDTSVDINLAIHQMSLVADYTTPYIGNPCMIKFAGAGVGGSGTFFNRAAIEGLTRPIFCNEQQQQQEQQDSSNNIMMSVCKRLGAKTTIDTTLYQHGDSIFDIFYKYSAIREFCIHSDGAMTMMINGYAEITGGGLKQFGQCSGGRGMTCPTSGAITCHYQDPNDMKQFALDRNINIDIVLQQQPQPPKREKSRLVLITGIFGISPSPPYFPMVLRSIQESGADGIIIGGDERDLRAILPPNVLHIPMTWDGLHDLISNKLFNGLPLPGFQAAGGYKVNDVKPLFGYLFQEILQGYEFWAHVDTDMIFGDVAGMLNPLMDQYDIISPANRGKNLRGCGYDDPIPVGETVPTIQCRLTRGYFMAYRNVPEINELFRLADADLYETLNTTINIAIDEWGHGGGAGYPSSMSYVIHKFKYMDSESPRVSLGLPFGWDGQDREDPDLNCIWSTKDGRSKLLANGIGKVLFCHFQFSKKIEERNKALWEMTGEDYDAILHSSSVVWDARKGLSAVNKRLR